MSKKLMLLAAGALTALAFAALPAVASAAEFPLHCETVTCTSTISGGHAELRTAGSAVGITCTTSTGTASQPNNTTTGSVQLTFHGCKDTAFGGACTSAGQLSGTIKTNSMVSHMIYIEHNKGTPGVLLTGANVTITCLFNIKKTVTGNVIGHWDAPNCGVTQSSHAVTFTAVTPGNQKFMQITTTGTKYDLISSDHAGGAYETASQAGKGVLTHATKTALTC
jgi:hypothetical protein